MAALLGLLVAAAFGTGDFLGGRASRHANAVAVLLVAQSLAVVGAVVVTVVAAGDPTGRDLAFGAAAGACNVLGLGALFRGLAVGRMGVVAPVTAVGAAVVPVVWGLLVQEAPAPLALVGAGLALVAGGLIAREPGANESASGLPSLVYALAAASGLGASFVLFAETSEDSGFYPVLTARAAAVVVLGIAVLALAARGGVRFPKGSARLLALGSGVLDVTATTLLLVAVRTGLAVEVAPIASLAPAFTVVLAWLLLREPIGRWQVGGLVLGVAGLVCLGVA